MIEIRRIFIVEHIQRAVEKWKDKLLGDKEKARKRKCHPKKYFFVVPHFVEIICVDKNKRPWKPHDRTVIWKRGKFKKNKRRNKGKRGIDI